MSFEKCPLFVHFVNYLIKTSAPLPAHYLAGYDLFIFLLLLINKLK